MVLVEGWRIFSEWWIHCIVRESERRRRHVDFSIAQESMNPIAQDTKSLG